ncbi:hypothetical protein [Micromonospora cremea]|uniref:Uncharacterized protein n=1 Tax=Micromonospora cremea TaxID=709881 RepID=A0A1N5V6L2_9ACTN|nr:hypothetical protein [Micromonospora cremea]SIM67865.1 hypothetical protein SAMN04489832_1355 [Micromonospora cremea]
MVTLHHFAMTLSAVVTPVELRPRRIWFIIAALVAVGGVLAAAGVMLFVLRSGGDLGQRLTPGQVVTVHLSPEEEKMVWVKETGQSVPDVGCDTSPVDGQEVLESREVHLLSENVELNVDNERWRGLLTLSAGPAGRYEVSCRTSGVGPAPTLSIGDPPRFYGARDTALGSLAAFGLASISVIIGGVLAVVVAVRRGLHRVRLRQQRTDANHG